MKYASVRVDTTPALACCGEVGRAANVANVSPRAAGCTHKPAARGGRRVLIDGNGGKNVAAAMRQERARTHPPVTDQGFVGLSRDGCHDNHAAERQPAVLISRQPLLPEDSCLLCTLVGLERAAPRTPRAPRAAPAAPYSLGTPYAVELSARRTLSARCCTLIAYYVVPLLVALLNPFALNQGSGRDLLLLD